METAGHDRGRSALVLYGTETGTAQDLAEEVGRCLERIHIDTDVLGLDAVSFHDLSAFDFTVFVVSTTGQGDFPANARKFWTSLLRKKLTATTLAGLDYAVVGIGDSSYLKFNFAARKLDKRLRQLGASSILDPCEADEQGEDGTDGTFLRWLQAFRETILESFPLSDDQEPLSNDVLLPSKWRLTQSPEGSGPASANGFGSASPLAKQSPDIFPVHLERNERVTPADHWQDVRFMSLKAAEKIDYMPGDALAIMPQNLPVDVDVLIQHLNWQQVADIPVRLVSSRPKSDPNAPLLGVNPIFSRPGLTLRTLLTEHLDINAIPRRSFFGCIANYTSDEMHKERLLEFTDPQYLDEYFDYATRPRRSILEILQEFDTVHLPWQEAINIFPVLRPRQFSIASGGHLKHAEDGTSRFELLIAIVKYRTVIKRIREGVCTKYLARLPEGTTLHVSLKKEGRFARSPSELAQTPHLLIGAGTGIAPLRSLINEKPVPSPTLLVFGCRNERADYFFRDEWTTLLARKTGLAVTTAFSRDQKQKVYVQDRIREMGAVVWDLVRAQGATIIVCGSAGQMPKAVRQAVLDALCAEGKKRSRQRADGETEEPIETEDDADRYITRLEREGRYKQETW